MDFVQNRASQKRYPLNVLSDLYEQNQKTFIKMYSKRLRGATFRRDGFCTKTRKQKTTPMKRFGHIFQNNARSTMYNSVSCGTFFAI